MARFLVDEDLPRSLARELRSAGVDAIDVRDVDLRGHSDAEIFEYAVQENRAIVSADVGFGNIMRFPLREHAGILVARYPNETSIRVLNDALLAAISSLSADDITGNIVVIAPGSLRIRRPL